MKTKNAFLFYWLELNFMLPLFQCVILLIAICKKASHRKAVFTFINST